MSRPVDVEKRADLLKQVVHHLQHHGLAQTSLSALADSVGTTKRMLLYYFGSRENLLSQALAANRPDSLTMFDDVHDIDGLREVAHALWESVTVGEQSGSIRMLLQLLSLAATDPEQYGDIAAEYVQVMTDPVAAAYTRLGHPPRQAWADATLFVSGLRGLCQDRLVTHDIARVDAAAHRLIEVAVAAAE